MPAKEGTRDELVWWLALRRVPGVGPVTYLNLVRRFGSPKAVFRATKSALMKVEGVGGALASAIRSFQGLDEAEEELQRARSIGVEIVTLEDTGYPLSLKRIDDPPPFIYTRGCLKKEDRVALAVVGSRAATSYGLRVAFRLARDLAHRGVTVVSGMARGIDSAAHLGALAGGGRTIAVLGSGINVIYPPENKELYEQISNSGAVITEFSLDAQPDAVNFPTRNRIISGLSLGVIIAEAAPKSGSLITARLALEQGREVFAVPGNIESMRSRGTHGLIRQGAHLVESADDVLEVLEPMLRRWSWLPQERGGGEEDHPEQQALSDEERKMLSAIGDEPLHIDELISGSGEDVSKAMAILLQLELKGHVQQLPGKRFVRAKG